MKKTLILAGIVAALGLGCTDLLAQAGGAGGGAGGAGGGGGGRRGGRGGGGGGAFNPQANLDAYRQALAVTDDTEWTAISEKITAVTTARQALGAAGGRGGRGGGRRGGGGAGGAGGAAGGGAPAATPTDAEAALQKAIDDKAPAADVKTKIAAVRAERKAKADAAQAAYVKAEDDLRSVLTARQEAILMLPVQGVFGGTLLQ
jgi:hypothetical protein